jgi:hypothetical protein
MRPTPCAHALTADQLWTIAQARCLGCKHFERTQTHGPHTCWRDPHYKLAIGITSPALFDADERRYKEHVIRIANHPHYRSIYEEIDDEVMIEASRPVRGATTRGGGA